MAPTASQIVIVMVQQHLKGLGKDIYGSLQLAHLKELVEHCANLRRIFTAFAALAAQSRRCALCKACSRGCSIHYGASNITYTQCVQSDCIVSGTAVLQSERSSSAGAVVMAP